MSFKSISRLFKLPLEESGLNSQRRVVLSNQIALLTLLLGVIYYIAEILNNSLASHSVFFSLSISCIVVLVVNFLGAYKLAKITGLSLINAILYLTSDSQKYSNTGIQLHFITAAIVALVLFGYEDKKWGALFTLIPFISFICSSVFNASIFPQLKLTYSQLNILLVLNISVFIAINLYLIFMLLRLHYKVEHRLLNRNAELEKTNAELDRFVYSASHDLRAPLSSISGLIALQKMEPNTTKYLDMIQSRVFIMDKFIHDIIDYSRNTRTIVVLESIRLIAIVQEIIDVLQISQGSNNLKIYIDIEDQYKLITDPQRLRVVLANLISNAIKYSDLKKTEPYIKIKANLEMDQNIIQIEDNGIGIEPVLQPKIFEMFFRATTASSGSGLGLYIVKESLEKLNGKISFHSKLGIGTTFKLSLPTHKN